jgi:hypothetical protein
LWAEDIAHVEFREEMRTARRTSPEKKTYQTKTTN